MTILVALVIFWSGTIAGALAVAALRAQSYQRGYEDALHMGVNPMTWTEQ